MQIPLFEQEHAFYVAFEVHSIVLVGALGEYAKLYAQNPDMHIRNTYMRNSEFITTLLQQSDERFVYDFRTISHPAMYTRRSGRISVHLICAMKVTASEAQHHAEHLFHLLNAQFKDVTWVTNATIVRSMEPWPIRHVASLMRRSEHVAVTPMTTPHPASTGLIPVGQGAHQVPTFYDVHAFSLSMTSHHTLYEYLLQHPHPISISIRMQRSQLSEREVTFCINNVQEQPQSDRLSSVEFHTIVQRKAHMYQMLQRQQQLVALITIDVVSPKPIPGIALTLIGNLLTQSYLLNEQHGTHVSSYHILQPPEHQAIAAAFRGVYMHLPIQTEHQPHERLPFLYDVSQAALVMRLPASSLEPLPGIEMRSHRQIPPPRDLSETGTLIGQAEPGEMRTPIQINHIDRTRHSYIIGQTGTGKSTVLKSMILDDIIRGYGVCAIDPHGDLINEVIAQIPFQRIQDVIVIDPTHVDAPIGINLFEYTTQSEREHVIQLFHGMMMQLMSDYGVSKDYVGPAFQQYLRNNAYWVTQDHNDPGTVLELYQMMAQADYHKRWLPIDESDAKLVNWYAQLRKQSFHGMNDNTISWSSYINSKFEDFIFDTRIRLIFGQKRSTVDFYQAINSKKIILVNLSRGVLSESAANFIGHVVLAKIQQAVLRRAELAINQRPFFSIYVDEFQNYTTESFVSLLSESRKYGVALTLANQFLGQIENKRIMQAILGNVGTVVAFRVGLADCEALSPRFAPEVSANDLINVPNWQAYVSMQVNGQIRRPFSMYTLRPIDQLDVPRLNAVIELSKQQYGTPRADVEHTIAQSLSLQRNPPALPTELPAKRIEEVIVTHTPQDSVVLVPQYARPPIECLETYTNNESTYTMALHGLGMSLWMHGEAAGNVNTIGLPPQFMAALKATRINTLPVMALAQQTELVDEIREHGLMNLYDVQQYLLFHQHQRMPAPSHAHANDIPLSFRSLFTAPHTTAPVTVANGILGHFAHTYRLPSRVIDMALLPQLGMMLEGNGTLTIWNTAFHAYHATIEHVTAIAATDEHGYALFADGRICNILEPDVMLSDLPPIRFMSAGRNFVACIDENYCCHFINADSHITHHTPEIRFRMIACGYDHVIGLGFNHEVYCWGHNVRGDMHVPEEICTISFNIEKIAAGYDQSFALSSQGYLYAWGQKTSGHFIPMALGERIVNICITPRQNFFQTHSGRWISDTPIHIPFTINQRDIVKIGSNADGIMYALYAPNTDILTRSEQLFNTAITDLSNLHPNTIAALHQEQFQHVGDILRFSQTTLATLSYFHRYTYELDTLIKTIQANLKKHRIHVVWWPEHPLTLSQMIPPHAQALWYRQACGLPTYTPYSAQPKISTSTHIRGLFDPFDDYNGFDDYDDYDNYDPYDPNDDDNN
jgi:hypothetical protein